MGDTINRLIALTASLPPVLIYLLLACWVGIESAGIGVPIEPALLFVGSLVSLGDRSLNVPLATLAASTGCFAFASVAYVVGRSVGTGFIVRLGRLAGLTQRRVDYASFWIQRRGVVGLLVVRLVPVVRSYGSYVIGAVRVPYERFAPVTFVGSVIYCGGWIEAGNLLGTHISDFLTIIAPYQEFAALVVILVIVIVVLILHFTAEVSTQRMEEYYHENSPCPQGVLGGIRRRSNTQPRDDVDQK